MALVRVKVHLPNPEDDVLTYAEDYPGLVDMESAADDLVPVYQRVYLRHGLVYVSPYVVRGLDAGGCERVCAVDSRGV